MSSENPHYLLCAEKKRLWLIIFLHTVKTNIIKSQKEYEIMDRFDLAKLFLMLSMLAALVFTAFSEPENSAAAHECLLFPQFVTTAASSKSTSETSESMKITYSFGVTELIKRLF